MLDHEAYFYSLVKPKGVKKNRMCLKCKTDFVSEGAGHRLCGQCAQQVNRQPLNARYAVLEEKRYHA